MLALAVIGSSAVRAWRLDGTRIGVPGAVWEVARFEALGLRLVEVALPDLPDEVFLA